MDFTGKTAIATGAASGMGLLFAQNFASLGGSVLMCDVNESVLNEKVSQINEKNAGKAVGMTCDVRDYHQVCAARDRAVSEFGSIDILISFAGGAETRVLNVDSEKYPEFPDVPIDVYDWGIDVNLKGPFYFAHAVLKQMRRQKRFHNRNGGRQVRHGIFRIKIGTYVRLYQIFGTVRRKIRRSLRLRVPRTGIDKGGYGKYENAFGQGRRTTRDNRPDPFYCVRKGTVYQW